MLVVAPVSTQAASLITRPLTVGDRHQPRPRVRLPANLNAKLHTRDIQSRMFKIFKKFKIFKIFMFTTIRSFTLGRLGRKSFWKEL